MKARTALGSPFSEQWLVLVEKTKDGKINTRNVAPVAFVPLTYWIDRLAYRSYLRRSGKSS